MRCIMYRLDIRDVVSMALGEDCDISQVDTVQELLFESGREPVALICWNADVEDSPFFDEDLRSTALFSNAANIIFSKNETGEMKYRVGGCDAYILMPGDKALMAVRVRMAVKRRREMLEAALQKRDMFEEKSKLLRKVLRDEEEAEAAKHELEKTKAELEETQKLMQHAIKDSGMLYFEYYPEERMAIEYNCVEAFEIDEILYDYPDSWFKKNITHPDDLEVLKETFRRIDEGAGEAECEIRNLRRNGIYVWERVIMRSVYDRNGSRIKVLCTGLDITAAKEAAAEYRGQIERVAGKEGKIIGRYVADLTTGACEIICDEYIETADVGYRRTINEVLSMGDSFIRSSQERDEHHRIFSRENMLKAYHDGERVLTHMYVARMRDNTILWIETDAYLMRDPGDGNIKAQMIKYDISDPYMRDRVIRRIADQDYEWLGLINPIKETTWRLTGHNALHPGTPPKEYDYPKVQQLTIENAMNRSTNEEKEQYIKATSIEHIKRELDFHGVYEVFLKEKLKGKEKRYKKITYSYADERNYLIAVKQIDITDVYDREKKSRDELRKALDISEEASETRNLFLANISHDMRTPLNGVMGFADLALDREGLPEDAEKDLKKIKESGELLLRLVDDTLDLSRLTSPRMALTENDIDFEKTIDDIADTMRPGMNEKNITFRVEKGARFGMVRADSFRVSQMLLNILSNAQKFTPAGGHIELIVTKKEHVVNDINCGIIVRDSGTGMSEDFIPKAFDVFSQEHVHGDDRNGGTGLGLSVVKRIVTLMRGRIQIKSDVGNGTEVRIDLPLTQVEDVQDKAPATAKNEERLSGKKVLLCEDHPVNTQLAKLMLSAVGIETTAVADGSLGVSIFSGSRPGEYDAILMDISMPVMDGLTATRKIRSLDRKDAATVPIIAMTANAYDEDVQKSKRAGMDAHISKPVDRGTLYRTLIDLIER